MILFSKDLKLNFFLPFIIAFVFFFGCESRGNKRVRQGKYLIEIVGTEKEGVEKKYSLDGKLVSETPFKDSKIHGTKIDYFHTGKIYKETPCEMGIVNGIVKEYYETGSLYKEIPTVKGKPHGVKKMYYSDGTLMAEVPYEKGKPLSGLKEYDKNGKLIDFPKLIIKGKDQTVLDDTYLIELSLSNGKKKVRYDLITIINGEEIPIRLTNENGVAFYTEYIPKGSIMMKKLHFRASFRTEFGNLYQIQQTHSIAVSNK